MTAVFAPPTNGPSTSREPTKNLREKEADSFHAALAAVLATGVADALAAGDHPRAISFINRGFAEGTPEMGCDLLRQAMTLVGGARTWTVQMAPLARVPQQPTPRSD
jgi:hypothetical protein